MRFRASAGWLLAATLGLSVMQTVSVGVPASAASCDYPVNLPVLDLGVSPTTITAGQAVIAFGSFRKNGCGIAGAVVQLQRRFIVNGTPSGSWTTIAKITTNSQGLYSKTLHPMRNLQLQAVIAATNAYPRTQSRRVSIHVRTGITEAVARPGQCKLTFAGSTKPRKRYRWVRIQKRGPVNHFSGWTTIARAKTNRHGAYTVSVKLTCGRKYNTSALIRGDSVNYAGRSATVFGIVAAH